MPKTVFNSLELTVWPGYPPRRRGSAHRCDPGQCWSREPNQDSTLAASIFFAKHIARLVAPADNLFDRCRLGQRIYWARLASIWREYRAGCRASAPATGRRVAKVSDAVEHVHARRRILVGLAACGPGRIDCAIDTSGWTNSCRSWLYWRGPEWSDRRRLGTDLLSQTDRWRASRPICNNLGQPKCANVGDSRASRSRAQDCLQDVACSASHDLSVTARCQLSAVGCLCSNISSHPSSDRISPPRLQGDPTSAFPWQPPLSFGGTPHSLVLLQRTLALAHRVSPHRAGCHPGGDDILHPYAFSSEWRILACLCFNSFCFFEEKSLVRARAGRCERGD